MKWADTAPTLAWDAVTSPRLGFRVDSGQDEHSIVAAGFKRVFHKLETSGNPRLQIPVFTGMTGFGAVLRFDDMVDIVNRRAAKGRLLRGDF